MTTTVSQLHLGNARSFLNIALYWAKNKLWDRAIDALKAAARSCTRAGLYATAGECFVAMRRCQDAQRGERIGVPAELRELVEAAGRQ